MHHQNLLLEDGFQLVLSDQCGYFCSGAFEVIWHRVGIPLAFLHLKLSMLIFNYLRILISEATSQGVYRFHLHGLMFPFLEMMILCY